MQYLSTEEGSATRSASLFLSNAFNKETFIFPLPLNSSSRICNDVVLETGGSGGGDGLEHIHPEADEIFAVKSGRLKIVANGQAHFVEAGQTTLIRRGVPHFFANGGEGACEFSVEFDPPQQHRRFFANFAKTTQRHPGWFSPRGKPKLLLIALILHRYHEHLYLARYPVLLQKLLFAALAPLARLRGYRLEVEPDQ